MRIVAGSDHAGLPLKEPLVEHLRAQGYEVEDLGTHDDASTDYPDFAHAVTARLLELHGGAELAWGLLVCGTGIGMCIAANRHPGIRAALCHEPYSARLTREHNDANVLCLGARVVGVGVAVDTLEAFLGASFEGGRHARRVGKIELPVVAAT